MIFIRFNKGKIGLTWVSISNGMALLSTADDDDDEFVAEDVV